MFRKLLLVVFAVFTAFGVFAQSTALKGKVLDKATGQPIPFANVVVKSGETQLGGTATDFEGNYTIKPLPPGNWTVMASAVGYQALKTERVLLKADAIRYFNIELLTKTEQIDEVQVIAYKVPLIDKDNTQSGETVTSEDIEKMPGRSVLSIASSVAGVSSRDGNGVGSIRGARGGNIYFVDGVRVRGGLSIPKAAQEQVQVITGGSSAKYGDFTGGIISITTKGATPVFFGGLEAETSEFLDKYGHNLAAFNFSGPLFSKKMPDGRKKAVLGYFVAADFSLNRNPRRHWSDTYRAKQEVIDDLLINPVVPSPTGVIRSAALYLDSTAFERTWVHLNTKTSGANFNGKLTLNASDNVTLTLGGRLNMYDNIGFNGSNAMFNWENNGHSTGGRYNIWARFTQKFSDRSPSKEEASASLVKNAFYQVVASYEQSYSKSMSNRHGENIWAYGHVGTFTTTKVETFEWSDTVSGYPNGVRVMNGWKDVLYDFIPSELNPDLAARTAQYYSFFDDPVGHYENYQQIINGGGLLNGRNIGSVYGNTLPGAQVSGYGIGDNRQFRVTASGSADIKNHEISFGFEFEQRDDRSWSVNAFGLWELARQQTNLQIEQLDWSNPIPVYDASGVFMDTIRYNRRYNADGQSQFDIKLREHLGMPVDGTEWIDIWSLDPSEFDLTYFSPDELLNNGSSLVGYRGYDLYGNRLKEKPTFEDYFTAKDENGVFKRLVGPNQPIYAAGYIQDKFAFDDLIFNIGVRVDRFDNNNYVLSDPYSLYLTKKVIDVPGSMNPTGSHPANMGDDYVVYVDDVDDPSTINGYRHGDQWYTAQGVEVEDPDVIASSTGVAPYLVNPDQAQRKEITADAFEDYTPQIVVMPRISFSFPISDEALFFAHYDVLSGRPGGSFNPSQYFFMAQRPGTNMTNPNLKPTKTIDYELGFQQKLTNSSSLKIAAYYREQRVMAQAIRVLGAFPVDYFTTGNIDFGTSKGLSISYDLRRTGNVSLRVNYTLAYAYGTGSSASQQLSLLRTDQPNLRILAPLSWDQRHKVNVNLDFRYDEGNAYNGPKLFGKDILANAGANFSVITGSGRPYSRTRGVGEPGLRGSLNGSRLPWTTNIKMRADKNFNLKFKKSGKQSGKNVTLNVYLDVDNLLNTKNVYGVYSATGDPFDDGYLTAPKMQQNIAAQVDPEAFRMYYMYGMLNTGHYSGPRTMRLGLRLNF
ncbi:MAG: carboxypeptidase-like regulatory domain-containing protein [Bacteroidales bacterium]|nr:carboxypeptidase-like regulatory domain-containing protein [Bacteroidales bacterium]